VLETIQEVQDDFRRWLALQAGCIKQGEEKEQTKRSQFQELLFLLRRVAPLPLEDLASVIGRTAQAMEYPHPKWIRRPEKAGHAIAPKELALLQRQPGHELLMRLHDIVEATLHSLMACWPENLLTMIDCVAKQEERQQVEESTQANPWKTDRLIQHIWSSTIYGGTPFNFLTQMFEARFTWVTTSGIPSRRGDGHE